jgi:protein O-mannosyl-transferase
MKSPRHRAEVRNKLTDTPVVDTAPGDTSLLQRLGLPALVFMIAMIPFLHVLSNQFVDWDDYDNLVNNPHYRGLAWSQLHWMFTTFHMGHYQPLSWVTFGLDYMLWGMNPAGYHLTNLILHAANSALFYFICRRLLTAALSGADYESWWINLSAASAALLFAVHPLRVESVAWATERRDVLSGLFFLWTIYCYLRAASSSPIRSQRRWLAAAVVVYALSLLSKATAITLPALLLLLDVYPLRRLQGGSINWFRPQLRSVLWEKSPFFVLACVFAAIALLAQHSTGALTPIRQYDIGFRAAQAFYGLNFYLWKTLLPTRLSPLYELPFDPEPWLWIFALCAVSAVSLSVSRYFIRHRWPAGLACWIYYVVTLAPVLGFAQSGPQLVADRYSYLPCLSWALLAAGAIFFYRPLSPDPRNLIATSVLAVGTLFILGSLTWQQTRVWRDTQTLWEHAITVTSNSSIAHYNRAKNFETQGRVNRAIELYRRAVTLNPEYADAHHNLARLLARTGQQEEAIRHYRRAIEIKPEDPDTHNNLGLLLARRGDVVESLEEFKRAVQIDPNYSRAYFNMGKVFAQQGQLEKAIINYQQALKLNPNEPEIQLALADVHVALARSLTAQGKKEEAERHYEEAVRIMRLRHEATSPH